MKTPVAWALLLLAGSTWASEASLDFGTVFNDRGEPPALHYRATYVAGDGSSHQVEAWRDGPRRLRRSTDGRLEVFVERDEAGDDFGMTVLDPERRVSTRIDRTRLYRIGRFTDWYDLAHVLKHPVSAYRLVADRPDHLPAPIAACDWYALTQGAATTRICWSPRDRIPLVIEGANTHWRVTEVDSAPIAPEVFTVHDEGFVRNDATQDIEAD